MIDKRLSHFEILEKLGSGGMGVVYRAFDSRLRRNVALKLLHQGALADTLSRERFVREAQTASSLNHRNIVTIHQIEEVEGRDFIAMELVDGPTLDLVVGDGGMELEQALRYGIQIGEALACAHEHGVVHRDLKPHNVMLNAEGEIKVLDFGLAKHVDPAGGSDEETDEGGEGGRADLLGTPAYMSPEQAQSLRIDARSDIFSFGVLFYEMLTGQKLFKRRTPVGILTAILQQEVDPPSSIRPGLPEELDRIVLRALAKDRDERYQTMRELVEDLERLSNQLYGTAFFSLPSPPSFWERNRGRLLIAGAVLLVLTASLSFWLGRGSGVGGPELENFRLLSTFPGSHREASLAPDGDRVAFVNDDGSGIPQLWMMTLSGGEPRALTRDPAGVERPRFHPDGERIFYGRKGGGVWQLNLASDVGPERVLEEGSWPHISPDGEMLVYERNKRIWIAGSDGAGPRAIESVPANYFAQWVRMGPTFSPDGKKIVYFAAELGPKGHLWIVPVDGGEPSKLTSERFYGGHPTWTPDGRHIVFQANFEGALTLWSIPSGGGEPHPMTSGAGEDAEPILSADGNKLIYTASRHTYTLTRARPGEAPYVLFESRLPVATPALSPDEGRLAFLWAEAADYQIATLDLETEDVRQMTLGAGQDNIIPQWSHDGQWIYYYQDRPVLSLQRVPAESGPSEIVMDGWHWASHNGASPSPDGRYLAYSLFQDGQWAATRLHHLETGEELELAGRLRMPRWSPDGRLLLGYDDTDQAIRICPVDGSACRDVDRGFQPHWVDEDTIAFARPSISDDPSAATHVEIWWRDLDLATEGEGEGEEPTEKSPAEKLAVVSGVQPLLFDFAVSADGTIYWNQDRPGKQELWVATVR